MKIPVFAPFKKNTSRYPSRTLRVAFATAEFSTKLDIGRFLSLWKRQ